MQRTHLYLKIFVTVWFELRNEVVQFKISFYFYGKLRIYNIHEA